MTAKLSELSFKDLKAFIDLAGQQAVDKVELIKLISIHPNFNVAASKQLVEENTHYAGDIQPPLFPLGAYAFLTELGFDE